MSPAWHAPSTRPPKRRRPLTLPIAALVVVLAAVGAGWGTEYAIGQAAQAHPSPGASPSVVALPSGGLVRLAPAAALQPDAALIAPVISAYFQAINTRDYPKYLAIQSQDEALTAAQFQAAFRSTQDSGMLVTGITTGPDGRPAADVTFTSRQQPQDGPGGESCTNWHLTMYFDHGAGTYTIGAPANGYKAGYQAC